MHLPLGSSFRTGEPLDPVRVGAGALVGVVPVPAQTPGLVITMGE